MHNKKLKGGIAVLALSAVLVGGTFAWLGDTDVVKNIFSTTASEGAVSKVEIYEKKGNEQVGTKNTSNKIVQVQNQSNYNSLIRASFSKGFEDERLNGADREKLSYIELHFAKTVIKEEELQGTDTLESLTESGKTWVEGKDGNYYYLGNVAPRGFTTQLLDGVSLSDEAIVDPDPAYRNTKFNVTVNAENIQSTAAAITSEDKGGDEQAQEVNGFGLNGTDNKELVRLLTEVVKSAAESGTQIEGTTETTESERE